jgi:uncharacterized membrane protein
MGSSLSEMPREYSRTTICNRSLSPVGRIVFLALIFSNVLIVAAGFAFVGAWVVLPFAGVEIVALGLAFYLVSLRDDDFERLTINNYTVVVDACNRDASYHAEFNRAWVLVVWRMDGNGLGCTLALRSHGAELVLGRLMNDEQRLSWSRELEGRLRIMNQ